jgi:hypothetical protein
MLPDDLIERLRSGDDPLHMAKKLLRAGHDLGQHTKSVANCHVIGLDSIVLFDFGEHGMIRYYDYSMLDGSLSSLYNEDGGFTIGVHNHRYEIAKIPLIGSYANVVTAIDETDGRGRMLLQEYEFSSGIGGELGVTYRDARLMRPFDVEVMMPGSSVIMQPEDLHTVVVPRRQRAAWMVIEGSRRDDITPLLYSPTRDLVLNSDHLYQPIAGRAKSAIGKLIEELSE